MHQSIFKTFISFPFLIFFPRIQTEVTLNCLQYLKYQRLRFHLCIFPAITVVLPPFFVYFRPFQHSCRFLHIFFSVSLSFCLTLFLLFLKLRKKQLPQQTEHIFLSHCHMAWSQTLNKKTRNKNPSLAYGRKRKASEK